MATWQNPVSGRIQAISEPWQGTPTFRVTQGYSSSHKALDIGNGRGNTDAVVAMRGGTVVKIDGTQGIIGVDHGDGFRSDYAHMRQLAVAMGAKVSAGQRLGVVSDAQDASLPDMAPHLHLVILHHGNPQDPWPYLNQQEGDTMQPIPGADFAHQLNKKSSTIRNAGAFLAPGGGTKYRDLPSGSVVYPTASTDSGYHACWIYDDAPAGYVLAWIAGGDLAAFTPIEEPAPPPDEGPDPAWIIIGRALGGYGLFLFGISVLALAVAFLVGAIPAP